MLTYAAVISTLLLLCEAVPKRRASNPTITISSGVLVGTATSVSNLPSNTGLVNAYIGVPYAQNPPARFEPPTAPSSWSSPLSVQTQKSICLQQFFPGDIGTREKYAFNNPLDNPAPIEDESCLYLSVYAPPGACAANPKPVLFWLFGGNLMFGGSSLTGYNGSSFALNQDVVVVVPNYRTNIFGFSNSPEVPVDSQNSGFLDQRFALQWVQDNIKAFGGDPTKVTIFGESAGAYSVKQLLAHPPSPLPYRAAILESAGLAAFGNSSDNYNNVAKHFGCDTQPSTLKCLQSVSATDIQTYITNNFLGFFPVVDNTNSDYHTDVQINDGSFAKVPILIGTNENEFTVFEHIFGFDNSTAVASGILAVFSQWAGPKAAAATSQLSSAIDSLLPTFDPIGNFEIIDRITTDLVFTCTTYALSKLLRQKGYNIWRYRYDASFPDLSFFPQSGAYHTSEISTVWGTYPVANEYGQATPTQVALSKYMQSTWAKFAKHPSAGPGWPEIDTVFGVNDLGVLGGNSNPGGEHTDNSFSSNANCEAFYEPILALANFQY